MLTVRSGPLQVDPNESCDFTFEVSPTAYMVHTSNNDRMSALCARYGLPHDADALRPTPSDRLREPRSTRLRIRVACHVCKTIFKGGKSCSKCGHGKCTDCKRKSITEPRLSTETNHLNVVDDRDSSSSDDDKSIGRSVDSESRPRSAGELEIDWGKVRLRRPVIERSKHVCHECSGEFNTIANSACGTCGHEKCPRCSRQLLHRVHPYNDACESGPQRPRQQRVHRPLRQRVRHFCERCERMFAPGTKVCAECSHVRCQNCPRHPSKRRRLATGRDPDPEVLRTEEAGMTEVSVPTPAASTSGTWNQVIE
jgi:hypothetical protein